MQSIKHKFQNSVEFIEQNEYKETFLDARNTFNNGYFSFIFRVLLFSFSFLIYFDFSQCGIFLFSHPMFFGRYVTTGDFIKMK